MTGPEFAAIRKQLGLTSYDFGRALGLRGTNNTQRGNIRRYVTGEYTISLTLERLAEMYARHGVPPEYLE